MRKLILLSFCLLLAIPCQAKIITVDDDQPADFNNIQDAIDDSNDGDTLIVADGTYTGDGNRDIDFLGKAVTVRSESGPDNCIIDCTGTLENKHRGFYFHSGEDNNSVVGGFTITNGYADRGGAIYCINSSPTLTNCIFVNNTAQYWEDYVSSTAFEAPEPMDNDGNVVHIMIPPPLPEWRGQGGGIYCRTSNPTLTNCKFTSNFSYRNGGGMYNYYNSNPTLINCRFSGNFVNSGIGSGGGIENRSVSSPTLRNCTFSTNSALNGGAIRNSSSSPSLFNCIFNGNSVGWSGACMHNSGSNPTLTNCTFSGNSAVLYGGVIFNSGSDATLSNCILRGNTATQGNEIYLDFYTDFLGSKIPSTINVDYSNVEGGAAGVYVDANCTLNWSQSNISDDPCFADQHNGDYHLKSQGGRWDPNSESWVQDDATSPCIDAGNPHIPIGKEPFPNGGRINMGVYGGTVEASKSYFDEPVCETIIAGDINGDCKVNFKDFALMALHWLEDNNTANQHCIVEDNVKYCIRTDKSVYHLGETVGIFYRISNLGSVPVSLGWAPIPPSCYRFVIVDNNGEHVWLWSWIMPPIPPVEFLLDAYESKEYEIVWDMINDNGTAETEDDFPAGPGMYKITGELLTGEEADRVRVSVYVNVRE